MKNFVKYIYFFNQTWVDACWWHLNWWSNTVLKRSHTGCHENNETARTEGWIFCDGDTWLSTLLLPWRQNTGLYRLTYVHTHTHKLSHIRESAPKVEGEGRGGSTGQSDISSWVPATVWKCHIIRPDTSIKVRKSFLTADSKRIMTSLHHPLCLALSASTTHTEKPPHV